MCSLAAMFPEVALSQCPFAALCGFAEARCPWLNYGEPWPPSVQAFGKARAYLKFSSQRLVTNSGDLPRPGEGW